MKDKLDLYSIEVITNALAHYIVIILQKSEKEKKKKKKKSQSTPIYI
jgi:hypothetical protein